MIRFSIQNPLMVNLVLVIVLLAGVLSWQRMPQEMFPVVEQDKVRITTRFEGASPEEVERQVTLPIEEAIDGMQDIDVVRSTSSEGVSTVLVELKSGANIDDFLRDLRDQIDQITDLPDTADKPSIQRLKTRFPVISVALYGEVSRAWLYARADEIKRRLQAIPGVGSVGVAGDRDWEIWVRVDPQRLAAMRVPLAQITTALRANLRDLPGGRIKAREGDILLRGKGNPPDARGIGRIVVRRTADGRRLLLAQVASIERRLEEARTLGRFNGRPSVNLTVSKVSDASTIVIARKVRELVTELRRELPSGVGLGVFGDLSVYVETRLNTVKSSGLVGLVLVLISLYLFLNFRVALITAMGIPVSFLVAVIGLYYFGYTINMVSLFAFLIALGMIVDDAIIVNENIFRHMEAGMPARRAAEAGAREVFWPVMVSTATTIAAFLPMFSVTGTIGVFIAVIPFVVTLSLLGSLGEAFGVLPSHAAELLRVEKRRRRSRIDWAALLRRYTSLLAWVLPRRYPVALATIGLLLVMLTIVVTRLPYQQFGRVDTGQFYVNIEAPNTYSLADSQRLAARIERLMFNTLGRHELDTVLTNVGVSFIDFNRFRLGSRYIQLIVDLKKEKPRGIIERYVSPLVSLRFGQRGERERTTLAIINQLRREIARIPGVVRLSILRPAGGPAGADIEIGISGPDSRMLRREADRVASLLRGIPGVYDVRHDMEPGKLEYRYTLNARGRELGITQQQLADAVRTGFLGLEVVHVTDGEQRIPVRLIYDERTRRSSQLARLPLVLADGRTVFLGDVAEIQVSRGLDIINRRDGRRLTTITAEVDSGVTVPLEVIARVQRALSGFEKRLPGYRILFLGEKKRASENFRDMRQALVIALAVIFFMLAALFRSLLDPLVVMFAIPFGLIGVVVGHLLFGFHLQFLSLIGFLALSGIVVNDSLILIDFARRLREQGMNRFDALVEAGRVRIRPILLTSITTFLGISPLIFLATGQTAFLSPMAVSLGFGLLFATLLILVALPCFYLIADDLRAAVCNRLRRWQGRPPLKEGGAYCLLADDNEENRRND